jgi:hypothetical protein
MQMKNKRIPLIENQQAPGAAGAGRALVAQAPASLPAARPTPPGGGTAQEGLPLGLRPDALFGAPEGLK